MSFTKTITEEPEQKLYLQCFCDEMKNSSLETTIGSHLEKKKFLRGLQVPGSCWMLWGCRDYTAQGRLCHRQSGSGSSCSMKSGQWGQREVRWRWQPNLLLVPSANPARAGVSPAGAALVWGWGVWGGKRQRAGRGRKIQWMANLSPNQQHECSPHFINPGFHLQSCLPTKTRTHQRQHFKIRESGRTAQNL